MSVRILKIIFEGNKLKKGVYYLDKLPSEKKLLIMAVPFIIALILFSYLPLAGWILSFLNFKPGVSLFEQPFVGLKNFYRIFGFASDFPRVFRNTLIMSFMGLALSPAPMIFAIMLSEINKRRVRKFFQTASSFPNFISFTIVYSIFFAMFNLDNGLVNTLLINLGITKQPVNPLGVESVTWYFQTAVGTWKTLGWSAIIYLSSMAGIDSEIYQASEVDGANRIQQIIHITIPGLLPTYVILLLLSVGALLSGANFEQILVFNNPLVSGKIETLDYYTYRIGLITNDYSLSTAIGMFKSIVSILLLFSVNNMAKKILGYKII
jgi:putative aldouronate transport system permease protein